MLVSEEAAGLNPLPDLHQRPFVDPQDLGSTGQGFGHLSDAHAIGTSPIPPKHHRYLKTIPVDSNNHSQR